MSQDTHKKTVAEAAADHIRPHLTRESVVGVGTGSTANYFIDALATMKGQFDTAVASSNATADRLKAHGIHVEDLNSVKDMDFYVDGADEANHQLQLIKGGGGALTREKIVASVASTFICIADESKLVTTLGQFPLPVEVIPMARSAVARSIVRLGGRPVYREGFVTDNGNVILDVFDLVIEDAVAVERALNNMTGVVTNGLFAQRPADLLLISGESGLQVLKAESTSPGS